MLPAAVMVLMSVWEQLLSPKRTACQAMLFILLACASGAAVCCWQGWVTNTLLLPFMALAFVLFRRALKPNVSVSQSILLFLSPATVAAVALMLSVCLNARREVTNVQPIYLLSTSHPGFGTGLLSVETVAKKYHGQMTVETENGVFRVNVLLNL